MLSLCADVIVAIFSSHVLCSMPGSISSVYLDSVNVKDIPLIVPSSWFGHIPSSVYTSFQFWYATR
jgi:hypothetical protein